MRDFMLYGEEDKIFKKKKEQDIKPKGDEYGDNKLLKNVLNWNTQVKSEMLKRKYAKVATQEIEL